MLKIVHTLNMNRINKIILNDMQKHGWWDYSTNEPIYSHKRPELCQINQGNCENWVTLAQNKFGGKAIWLTDWKGGDPCHCVLKLKSKYYDSECIKGIWNWKKLPIFNR